MMYNLLLCGHHTLNDFSLLKLTETCSMALRALPSLPSTLRSQAKHIPAACAAAVLALARPPVEGRSGPPCPCCFLSGSVNVHSGAMRPPTVTVESFLLPSLPAFPSCLLGLWGDRVRLELSPPDVLAPLSSNLCTATSLVLSSYFVRY